MKNSEFVRLYNGLIAVKNMPGAKFAYAVARNIAIIKPIVEAIEKALPVPEKYVEYQKIFEERRLELCKLHAKKDERGKPVTEVITDAAGRKQERYVFYDDDKSFAEGYQELTKELDETYKDMFDEIAVNKKEYMVFLDTECADKPVLIKVKADNLPEGINAEQIEAIIEIIE